MTSKVLVKLSTLPFTQGKPAANELVALQVRSERAHIRPQGINDRATLLEQNIKFLQEQHQATLIALHQEVEVLRQRNRDLQFQLVFTKDIALASRPSSPVDNGFEKSKVIPVSIDASPSQIKLLERDLEQLRVSLEDMKKQNEQLQTVISEQKMELEKMKIKIEEPNSQMGDSQNIEDLVFRLEDAEGLVKRLTRENANYQKEIAWIKSMSDKNVTDKNRNRSSHGHRRGVETGRCSRGVAGEPIQSNRLPYKFPPLEGELSWRNMASRGSYDHYSAHYQRRNRSENDPTNDMSCIVLPELQIGTRQNNALGYPQAYRSHKEYHNGSKYHRDSGNRKFRGQGRQRRERESDEHRRDYKDKTPQGYDEKAYNVQRTTVPSPLKKK